MSGTCPKNFTTPNLPLRTGLSTTYDTASGITYGAAYDVAFCTAFLKVAIALQGCCYIIPHPMIYILPKFDANWLNNNKVIEWAPF